MYLYIKINDNKCNFNTFELKKKYEQQQKKYIYIKHKNRCTLCFLHV